MAYKINGKQYVSVIKCLSALKIPSNGFFEWYRWNCDKFSSKEEGLQHYVDLVSHSAPILTIPSWSYNMFECKVCKCRYIFTRKLAFDHIEECCSGNSKLFKHWERFR